MRTCIFSSRQILTCTSIRHVNAISQFSRIRSKGLIYGFPIAAQITTNLVATHIYSLTVLEVRNMTSVSLG